MKKRYQTQKGKKQTFIRRRYSEKRLSETWKRKKLFSKKKMRIANITARVKSEEQAKKPYLDHPAPKNFSLIDNTNEVLAYFNNARDKFKDGNNIRFDISGVSVLTPPTIALLVASINSPSFVNGANLYGTAPVDQNLLTLFKASGFYNFVTSRMSKGTTKGNLLLRESDTIAVGSVAKEAVLTGIRHTFKNENPFEPLYDILIECMVNTNNHANLNSKDKCKWWLYVYTDSTTSITSYSFFDLGIGIFESKGVQGYIKKILKATVVKNIDMVDKLLAGELGTRMTKDSDIRGKGLPQIVEYSKQSEFKEFYIIANNVKIDLKTGNREELSSALTGTFLYWEIH